MMLLPSPKELRDRFPAKQNISWHRENILNCLKGSDRRLLLIIGPCSLHDRTSALTFARRLKTLQDEVNDTFLLVMRAYIEKPRTSIGWKGPLYSPAFFHDDLASGLVWVRETLLALSAIGLPLATEFLEPLAAPYIEEFIALGFIGSRTASSQIHRQLASALPCPVAFKNTPDGTLSHALAGMRAASHPHTFFSIDENGRLCSKTSPGNPHTFLCLRGADDGPNTSALCESTLPDHLIVDCSHGNSQKQLEAQAALFEEMIAKRDPRVRGLMLESHLQAGRQDTPRSPNLSLTDPCLSFEESRSLIHAARETLAPAAV